MKSAAPKDHASPGVATARPFFQTKPDHAVQDGQDAAIEQQRDGAPEPLAVQRTPAFEGGDEGREAALPVQRKPAFEGEESPVQTEPRGEGGNALTQSFFPAAGDGGYRGTTAAPFFPPVQGKLTVGRPGDRYEREADAVAEQVVGGQPAPAISALPAGGLRRNARVQTPATLDNPRVADAIENRDGGEPLQPAVQDRLESGLGHDLSAVRVHDDADARDTANSLRARAFTQGNDIWLGPGESQQDTRLMAHEATHVVQQSGGSGTVQRAPAATTEAAGDVAPGSIELKDQAAFTPEDRIAAWLEQRKHKRGPVRMRFGTLAEGTVEVRKRGDDYSFKRQALPLKHPVIRSAGENLPAGFMPSLIVSKTRKGQVAGFVSLRAAARSPNQGFNAVLRQAPEVIGMAGFDLSRLPGVTNKLDAGKLHLGMTGIPFRLGGAFSGTFDFTLVNEAVTFDGSADVSVQGLATGQLSLKRDEKGSITGKVAVALELPKNFSGSVDVAWDGRVITGMGKVGYQGEKLSGEVTLQLMEKRQALALEQAKKAPPEEGAAPAAAGAGTAKAAATRKSRKVDYVVFGEGDLTFAFTDWLNGTAHVIVDPKGFVTIIGKITPQKEFELFPQKDYNKKLLKLEARAAYGIPVVGNVFIFANIGLNAFAKLGPAKFYKIEVAGTYSTDPEKNKDFSIKGSLNISAAAGLTLRGEVGAGIEILDHDLKAGGGVNATAGIKGYAEATPIIGYREKGAPGEDKKGEFFIRGDLEIAAQPFFALGGDLFVEVDSPWWSPLPDKRWTWPLGNKEWPLGDSFGFGASVDYVFGSGKPPEISFPPVDFSAEKFTSDMMNNKTKPKTKKEPKEGKWKEKNTKAAEPPPKTGGPGAGVALGKPGAPTPGKPAVSKQKKNPATPGARTASGKSVKEYKDAARKGKQGTVKTPEGVKAKTSQKAEDPKKQHDEALKKGLAALEAVTARYAKDGATKDELATSVKAVRRKFKIFKSIKIIDGGDTWDYEYIASPGKQKGAKKKQNRFKAARRADGTIEGRWENFVWSGYPNHTVTPHPANAKYGHQNATVVPQPRGGKYVVGEKFDRTTPGAKYTEDWRIFLYDQRDAIKDKFRKQNKAWSKSRVDRTAKLQLEQKYNMPWLDLDLRGWEGHHIRPVNYWNGSNADSNFQYLKEIANAQNSKTGEHSPFKTWWDNRKTELEREVK